MAFTPNDVKILREKTGCGMMDCKKALTHSNGNMEDSITYLREQGLAALSKKSGRSTAEGVAYAISKDDAGIIIEVNSETDFVASNKDFQNFVEICANTAVKSNVKDVNELLDTVNITSSETIGDLLKNKILTMGENINIRRFEKINGLTNSYVHLGGKIAVLVKFSDEPSLCNNEKFKEVSKDIAMQIAAANPTYLDSSAVDVETLEKEKNILKEQMSASGKPESIVEKIVLGRISKFYKEVCLLEQPFVKDSSLTVMEYLEKSSKEIGLKINVEKFVRYERGEGIEKKKDDFASEVSQMIK